MCIKTNTYRVSEGGCPRCPQLFVGTLRARGIFSGCLMEFLSLQSAATYERKSGDSPLRTPHFACNLMTLGCPQATFSATRLFARILCNPRHLSCPQRLSPNLGTAPHFWGQPPSLRVSVSFAPHHGKARTKEAVPTPLPPVPRTAQDARGYCRQESRAEGAKRAQRSASTALPRSLSAQTRQRVHECSPFSLSVQNRSLHVGARRSLISA